MHSFVLSSRYRCKLGFLTVAFLSFWKFYFLTDHFLTGAAFVAKSRIALLLMEYSVGEDCVKAPQKRQSFLVKLSHFLQESSLKSTKILSISIHGFH